MAPLDTQDTHPDAERVRIRLLRAMPWTRKLELVGSAYALSRELILADLRVRFPDASDAKLHEQLRARFLGTDHLAVRAYARRRTPG